jgi:AcrR family transcriptional regulator
VAVRSNVSRATAYRYFPSRSALITSVVDASLGPVRQLEQDTRGGRERVHAIFKATFPRFKEFEPQLRAACQPGDGAMGAAARRAAGRKSPTAAATACASWTTRWSR